MALVGITATGQAKAIQQRQQGLQGVGGQEHDRHDGLAAQPGRASGHGDQDVRDHGWDCSVGLADVTQKGVRLNDTANRQSSPPPFFASHRVNAMEESDLHCWPDGGSGPLHGQHKRQEAAKLAQV